MSIFDGFPRSNAYQINLDWLLKSMRELETYVKNYTAINNVAYAGIWDITKQYPKWALVSFKDSTYMSLQPVPVGVPLENEEYWIKLADLDPRIAGIIKDIADLDHRINKDVADINSRLEESSFVSVLKFGAKGDGATDDTEAFQNAIDFCIANNKSLFIPAVGEWNNDGGYILSKTLNVYHPMTIICAPNAILNWKHATNAVEESGTSVHGGKLYKHGYGVNIDYGKYRGHKGFYFFGIIQGCKDYTVPGGTAPSGEYWTGVRIANGDLVDFHALYISYWKVGIELNSNADFTGNTMLSWGVMDDCATGLLFNTDPNNAISATQITFNTIGICREGIKFVGNGTVDHLVLIGDGIWCEYPGYTAISNISANLVNSQITINNVFNRNTHETVNKTGDSTEWYGAIIGGENEFKSVGCTISIGVYNGKMSAGDPIMFNVGGHNLLFENTWLRTQNARGSTIPLIGSAEESKFNGGVGGALHSQDAFLKFTAEQSYSVGDTIELYGFSQLLYNDSVILLTPITSCPFIISTENLNHQTKRCFKITLEVTKEFTKGWEFVFYLQTK